MTRSKIAAVKVGEINKVQGFVENIRDKKWMAFLVVRDVSGKLQLTIEKEKHPELAEVVKNLTIDSVVTVEGMVVENSYVKLGGIEMLPDTMTIESVAAPLPIEDKSAIDLRLDYRWLDLRSERNTLIFRVQTLIAAKLREFLLQRDFVEIHTPKLIGAASESGADVFELTYFDRKAYLAQSPQFYKQMAMAAGFERIFECGPVFRAEKSNTNKHATEFTGFDLEFSYIESYEDVMKMEEEMIAYVLGFVKEQYGDKIQELFGEEVVVPTLPFPRMKLADLYTELKARGLAEELCEKGDLCTEGERMCKAFTKDKFDHEFLFVTDFSPEKRAFYHMRNEEGIPQGYDLIWKGCEITTGAQREHRYEVLKRQADEKGLGEDVKFYLEFFKYGCPPHGGFGIGLDRMTMILLNIAIKEVEFLFRGPDRLTP